MAATRRPEHPRPESPRGPSGNLDLPPPASPAATRHQQLHEQLLLRRSLEGPGVPRVRMTPPWVPAPVALRPPQGALPPLVSDRFEGGLEGGSDGPDGAADSSEVTVLSAAPVPARSAAALVPVTPAGGSASPSWARTRVMVVDDVPLNLKVAVTLLRRCGVEVAKQCVNGEEAALAAAEEPFDIIFMDVRLCHPTPPCRRSLAIPRDPPRCSSVLFGACEGSPH